MDNPISKIRLSNPVHLLATGFGSGLSPIVPGTMGTLAAVPFYYLLVSFSPIVLAVAIVLGSLIGVYLCGRTSGDMGVHDHGSIVWDEFVGFWITMFLVPVTDWQVVLAGFIIFRFFDMVKPWPISWLDKQVHGGFGIMLDDIVAGLMSMVTLWMGYTYLLS
ncbi:phosphatidylglycerophosphatase A [Grimontia kaedaensis]|uniref:Phosphatidylglycerophosphatase A n=1 Tax=Grimontia kaedaensis TaxID=2872157 RepID=A0ABY4WQS2_9GAMM|nr:phosphatidylglycerophosphatase A [Grimontia kaedaensis]USH01844.1 phosphatidylglycerophosphatase A [Grimontia kaedaensis]